MAISTPTGMRQVILRSPKYDLPCNLVSGTDGKRYSATIKYGQVTDVPEPIYNYLKSQFGVKRKRQMPDGMENLDHPHKPGEPPIMLEEEVPGAPIIEFL